MKRKILMIILCGFMILGSATGCGNKTKSDSSSDKPNKTDKVERKYAIGDKVYFNPETAKKCNMSDVEYSLEDLDKGREEVNVKSGCMRWYVINNEDNKLDLILDHRTTFETNYSNLSSGICDCVCLFLWDIMPEDQFNHTLAGQGKISTILCPC